MGPTDQVGGAGAAGSCAGGVDFAAVPSEGLGSAVEGVCARAGPISTEFIRKAAKHLENTVILISPFLSRNLGRNDAGRRLAADCTRCFFETPTENNNPPNSNSAWTAKFSFIKRKICGWLTCTPSCMMRARARQSHCCTHVGRTQQVTNEREN